MSKSVTMPDKVTLEYEPEVLWVLQRKSDSPT